MTFTDPLFLCCLLLTVVIFYLIPVVLRPYLLFAVSVAFYLTWGTEHVWFLLAAGLVGWLFALFISALVPKAAIAAEKPKKPVRITGGRRAARILILWLGVLLLVGMWIYAKYGEFFAELFQSSFRIDLKLIVPLGISYYTLSVIGYMADVYYRKVVPTKNPLKFLMFVMYFPKVLQGPIDSYKNLDDQIAEGHRFDFRQVAFGGQLLLYGLFKKLVIADRLAVLLGGIFAEDAEVAGSILLLGLLLRPLELYCDFSGYMDIAEGISEMFGIRMADNFRRPFFSRTAPEFWRRWHITLGGWFKDYVYMPIAVSPAMLRFSAAARKKVGKRTGQAASVTLPLLLVWILTGIWHGTGWNYVIWGLYWGILIWISTVYAQDFARFRKRTRSGGKSRAYRVIQMVRTYLLFAIGRWITLTHAETIWPRITEKFRLGALFDYSSLYQFGLNERNMRVMVLGIFVMWGISLLEERGKSVRERVAACPLPVRWLLYYALAFAVLIFGYYGPAYDASAFIYMQF